MAEAVRSKKAKKKKGGSRRTKQNDLVLPDVPTEEPSSINFSIVSKDVAAPPLDEDCTNTENTSDMSQKPIDVAPEVESVIIAEEFDSNVTEHLTDSAKGNADTVAADIATAERLETTNNDTTDEATSESNAIPATEVDINPSKGEKPDEPISEVAANSNYQEMANDITASVDATDIIADETTLQYDSAATEQVLFTDDVTPVETVSQTATENTHTEEVIDEAVHTDVAIATAEPVSVISTPSNDVTMETEETADNVAVNTNVVVDTCAAVDAGVAVGANVAVDASAADNVTVDTNIAVDANAAVGGAADAANTSPIHELGHHEPLELAAGSDADKVRHEKEGQMAKEAEQASEDEQVTASSIISAPLIDTEPVADMVNATQSDIRPRTIDNAFVSPAERPAAATLPSSPDAPSAPFIETARYDVTSATLPSPVYPPLLTKFELKPLSEEQLQSLYYNKLMESQDDFVDGFVQSVHHENHELWELLMNYYRSRHRLASAEQDIDMLHEDFNRQLALVWTSQHCLISVQDKVKVTKEHSYEQAVYSEEAAQNLGTRMTDIRSHIHDTLSLHAYSSQLCRLQVESYLHELYKRCPDLAQIPHNSPVTASAVHQRSVALQAQVDVFRECISVLFSMQRRPSKDSTFVEDNRLWLKRLIASLLRVASVNDHLFILHHVMRCPAGIGQWGASLVQVCPPSLAAGQVDFNSLHLDNFMAMMAAILLPVAQRNEFLSALSVPITPLKDAENPWILVDSDGEEDEDPEQSFLHLAENDFVSLLDQLPLDVLYRHILLFDNIDEVYRYDVSRSSETSVLKLLAFCSSYLRLLARGLQNFVLGRYRQLNKRIARMIRQCVQYLSDHWENFKKTYSHLLDTQPMQQLQLEFDHVFKRATVAILSAPRLGSWQFLADFPYEQVSQDMMWQLTWLIHREDVSDTELQHNHQQFALIIEDDDEMLRFEERLKGMPATECIYLLTTLANMARSRTADEKFFIETIAAFIYDIAYVREHTRELCSKVGRELLSSIALQHPFVLSLLLLKCKAKMDKVTLYLYDALPIYSWKPSEDDRSILREWLLEHDPGCTENQLARRCFEQMNWGTCGESRDLYLPREMHLNVAIIAVEAFAKHLSAKNVVGLISDSFKQVASVVKREQTAEQQLSDWAWKLILRLRLHDNQALCHQRHSAPILHDAPELHVVMKGVKDGLPIALYAALACTLHGHGMQEFCEEGVVAFLALVDQGQYVPAIIALSFVSPNFYKYGSHLTSNSKFVAALDALVRLDYGKKGYIYSDFPGPVTKLLAEMITSKVEETSHQDSISRCDVTSFWLGLLFAMTRWQQERSVLYLVDEVFKMSFAEIDSWRRCLGMMREQFQVLLCILGLQNLVNAGNEQGVLSTFVSWLSSGNSLPSFIEASSQPEFCWFAFAVLDAESFFESKSEIWHKLQAEMTAKSTQPIEASLKKVLTSLKVNFTMTSQRLTIYRWAAQAIDTPTDHPILPLIWQRFFTLFLARFTPDNATTARGGVGERFFDLSGNLGLMKKMKKCLSATADYFHNLEIGDSEINPQLRHFYSQLVRYYQMLGFWLDEPRLHDPTLYLPALPPQYDAQRLLLVFNNNLTLWKEYVNNYVIQNDTDAKLLTWNEQIFGAKDQRRESSPPRAKIIAAERIVQRLQKHDQPLPPPQIVPVKPPLPEVNVTQLLDKHALLYTTRCDFTVLIEYAKIFTARVSKNVGVDENLLDLLPSQFHNETVEETLSIPCSTINPFRRCAGPALATVRFEARTRNEITQRKIDENRAEAKQMLIEAQLPPPATICSAAVHIENVITALVRLLSAVATQPEERAAAMDAGTALFYHMSSYVTDDAKYYPPTYQFFSACIEMLGKEFILNNPSQSQPLMQAILQTPSLVGLLSPNFTPNASPDLFVEMYEDMLDVARNQGASVAFTLLTKFDVTGWLQQNPPLSRRAALLSVLGRGLTRCGVEPPEALKVVFDCYRTHLLTMVAHRFPDHYGDSVKLLVAGVRDTSISVSIWRDFLNLFATAKQSPVKGVKLAIPLDQLKETAIFLSNFWLQHRVASSDSAAFGLFPKMQPYVAVHDEFLQHVTLQIVQQMTSLVKTDTIDRRQGVSEMWQLLVDAYAPFIQPLQSAALLSPFTDDHVTEGRLHVAGFTQAVEQALNSLEGECWFSAALLSPFTDDHVTEGRLHVAGFTQAVEQALNSLEGECRFSAALLSPFTDDHVTEGRLHVAGFTQAVEQALNSLEGECRFSAALLSPFTDDHVTEGRLHVAGFTQAVEQALNSLEGECWFSAALLSPFTDDHVTEGRLHVAGFTQAVEQALNSLEGECWFSAALLSPFTDDHVTEGRLHVAGFTQAVEQALNSLEGECWFSAALLSPFTDDHVTEGRLHVAGFTQAVEQALNSLEAHTEEANQLLTHLWTYYYSKLATSGSQLVLNVFHQHLNTLHWRLYVPDVTAMDVILKIHDNFFSSCFDFVADVMLQVDWLRLLAHLDRHGSTNVAARMHVCIFFLLVQIGTDSRTFDKASYEILVRQMEPINWSYVDHNSFDIIRTWFLQNSDCAIVYAPPSSRPALVLSVLKWAAGYRPRARNTVLHPQTADKRRVCARCLVELVVRACASKEMQPEVIETVVSNLLNEAEGIVSSVTDLRVQQIEATNLCAEILGLLNNCTTSRSPLVLAATTQWITSSPGSVMLLPLMTAACKTLVDVTHMAAVLEAAIDAHFANEKPAVSPVDSDGPVVMKSSIPEDDVEALMDVAMTGSFDGEERSDEAGWSRVLTSLQIPDACKADLCRACVDHGAFLVLYACVLQNLPKSQSLEDEAVQLRSAVTPENEAKLILLWSKVLELSLRQLDLGGNKDVVIGYLSMFVASLGALGEDKSSSGVLGALGLGKKSALSTKFRLIARAIACFTAVQLVEDRTSNELQVRLQPQAPGLLGRRNSVVRPTAQGKDQLSALETLRGNKHYAQLRALADSSLTFIKDARRSFRDGCEFLTYLSTELFPEHIFLAIFRLQYPTTHRN